MQKGVVGMNISPASFAVVIAVFMGLAFSGGFAISDWRSQAQIKKLSQETKVCAKPGEPWTHAGFGTRGVEYGGLTHLRRDTREEAEQFLRKLNMESVYVKQGEPEYELVELFYRKVN